MQKLENLANMLDRAECPEEAEFVRDLWQQRAELLEACRVAMNEMCNTIAPRNSFTDAVDRLDAAITKAEATE